MRLPHFYYAYLIFYKLYGIVYYNKCKEDMEVIKLKRQQALEDLFLAARKHLLNCGRTTGVANMVASKVWDDAVKANLSIEDIKSMRDVFLA